MTTVHFSPYPSVTAAAEPPIAALYETMHAVLGSPAWESSPHFGELQRMVRATAAAFRDRGYRPEEVILALKCATRRGALRPLRSREDDLHYQMTLWSVLEYFRCDP